MVLGRCFSINSHAEKNNKVERKPVQLLDTLMQNNQNAIVSLQSLIYEILIPGGIY